MLAVLDANGYVVVIGAVGIIAVQLYTMYLKHLSDSAKLKRDEYIADKLIENTKLTTELAKGIEEIHKTTNSMKDELVKVTSEEGLARGGMEERARADAREVVAVAALASDNSNVAKPHQVY